VRSVNPTVRWHAARAAAAVPLPDQVRIKRLKDGSYCLTARMHLPASRERAFEFFSDAANLGEITPPDLRFQMLTASPIRMAAGKLIDYSIALWRIPMRWQTSIATWEPPNLFVDEQLRGPYRSWVHTHRFRRVPWGTLIEDEVAYTLPLGRLGRIAAPLVRRELERIFRYRHQRVRALVVPETDGPR
jgi:ligand-binding SRPBCC domain-containing protein